MKIVTSHDPNPYASTRAFDWSATTDNYDASYEGPEDGWVANEPVGYGATEEAAIADLKERMEDA